MDKEALAGRTESVEVALEVFGVDCRTGFEPGEFEPASEPDSMTFPIGQGGVSGEIIQGAGDTVSDLRLNHGRIILLFGLVFALFADCMAFGLPRNQNAWLLVSRTRTTLQTRSYRGGCIEIVRILRRIVQESRVLAVEMVALPCVSRSVYGCF